VQLLRFVQFALSFHAPVNCVTLFQFPVGGSLNHSLHHDIQLEFIEKGVRVPV
jgi:hypothetical protein